MTLSDLRKLTIRQQTTIRFQLRNGMECVISEQGIAQVPALKGVPDFNLETELAAAQEFQIVTAPPTTGKASKEAAPPTKLSRAELVTMASGGSATAHTEADHDDE